MNLVQSLPSIGVNTLTKIHNPPNTGKFQIFFFNLLKKNLFLKIKTNNIFIYFLFIYTPIHNNLIHNDASYFTNLVDLTGSRKYCSVA